jgi:hypothetical protein
MVDCSMGVSTMVDSPMGDPLEGGWGHRWAIGVTCEWVFRSLMGDVEGDMSIGPSVGHGRLVARRRSVARKIFPLRFRNGNLFRYDFVTVIFSVTIS